MGRGFKKPSGQISVVRRANSRRTGGGESPQAEGQDSPQVEVVDSAVPENVGGADGQHRPGNRGRRSKSSMASIAGGDEGNGIAGGGGKNQKLVWSPNQVREKKAACPGLASVRCCRSVPLSPDLFRSPSFPLPRPSSIPHPYFLPDTELTWRCRGTSSRWRGRLLARTIRRQGLFCRRHSREDTSTLQSRALLHGHRAASLATAPRRLQTEIASQTTAAAGVEMLTMKLPASQ